jgi:hypothetical protein
MRGCLPVVLWLARHLLERSRAIAALTMRGISTPGMDSESDRSEQVPPNQKRRKKGKQH